MPGLGLGDSPDEPHGRVPVHYQISVTGRQAAAFFLLLLASLGLSFFFGMRTGASARKGPGGAAAVIASASDIPVPTLAPAEGVREEKKPAEEALGLKAEERKAAEEKEARDSRKTAESPPAAVPAAAPAAVLPTATAAPAPTPKPAPPKPAGKPAAKGPFYVQVLATKNAAAADELAKRLKGEGFAADVAPVPGKPDWFRVHVGPFKDHAKAVAVARKIKATDKQIKKLPLVVP
jgi:cell division septation protein DedD